MSKRGGTASMIVASVCNEHKNSDLRANSPAILIAFNDRLEELEAERETLRERAEAAEAKLAGMKQEWRVAWNSHGKERHTNWASKQDAIAHMNGEPAFKALHFVRLQSRDYLIGEWQDVESA